MIKIKTALCSFGMSGRVFHAPFITSNSNFHLAAVVERSSKAANKLFPLIKSFNSIEEMLADEAVDLVVVNTPNATHFDFTKKALLADKHVIVEKPFVVNSIEGEELIEIANANNRKLAVYHNRRWDSDFLCMKQVVEAVALGDIVEAEFHYDRYKLELSAKAHKETAGPGAGLLYDLGPHLIDQAMQLFGKPEAVFADIASMRPGSQVDDYFELLLYYNDKRVRLKASNIVREPQPAYVLHGTKGSFTKSRTDVQEADLQAGKTPLVKDWGIEPENAKGTLTTDTQEKITAPQGNYMSFYDQMAEAILNNAPVPVAASEALEVIKIIEAALVSHKEKKVFFFSH
jgi:predicted dehydrogenase